MRARDIQNVGQTPYAYVRQLLKHKNADNVTRICGLIVNDDSSVSVWLHSTEIVRAYSDGRTIIRNGGWETVTTKRYLNKFLPTRVGISQKNFVWKLYYFQNGMGTTPVILSDFTDGMVIGFDDIGRVSYWNGPNPTAFYMRKIHNFATRFVFESCERPTNESLARFVSASGNQWDEAMWTNYPTACLALCQGMRDAIGTPAAA